MLHPPRLPDRMFVTPRVVAALILLILGQVVVAQSLNLFPRLTKIDFFQYWGVAAARRLSGDTLGPPYTDFRVYRAVLNDYAARSGDPKLQTLKGGGFTATPFAYLLFAAFPADYARALPLFHALQILLFLAAVILLGEVYHYPLFPLLCLALLLVLGSGPLFADLRVGNIGCFQFFALAALLALADRLQSARRPVALGAALLSGLTLLALVKPNVAPVIAVMALHLWLARGTRSFAIAVVPAALCGAAAVIVSSVYFGSWMVWQDWYRVVFGINPYRLARAPIAGNYSTSRLLSVWLHADVWLVGALIAAALLISVIAVTAASVKATALAHAIPTGRALARALTDPHLATAIGVTATLALPPLVWYHYFLIALIPGMWLLTAPWGRGALPLWGLATLGLNSGILNVVFLPLGWPGAAVACAGLSWVPLWGGILFRLYSAGPRETEVTSAPSRDESPRERRTSEGRRARNPRTRHR